MQIDQADPNFRPDEPSRSFLYGCWMLVFGFVLMLIGFALHFAKVWQFGFLLAWSGLGFMIYPLMKRETNAAKSAFEDSVSQSGCSFFMWDLIWYRTIWAFPWALRLWLISGPFIALSLAIIIQQITVGKAWRE